MQGRNRRILRSRARLIAGAALAGIVSIGMNTVAYAQSVSSSSPAPGAPAQVDATSVTSTDIVVTAQRRQQRAQDVPASLAAISGDQLIKRQITTINQLAAAVPNMQASQPYGAGNPPSFTIRGISTTDASQNQSRPIAMYIDEGIRQLPLLEAMPLFDIDHVEVLRGPQGALYGKNATGGAVGVITKQPGFETSGYLSAGYGDYDRWETQGAVQFPLVKDELALRIAYTFTKDDGIIKEVSSSPALKGKNLDQTDILGVRAALRFRPTNTLDIVLRYNHYRIGGRTAGVYAGNDIDFASVGLPVYDTFPGAHREGLGFFENNQDFIGRRNMTDDGLNNQIKWSIAPEITLLSLTTYDQGKWLDTEDADGLPLIYYGNQTINARNTKQFVQELRLNGTTGPFIWLAGGFYSHDSVDIYQNYPYYTDPRCGAQCDFGLGGGGTGYIQTNQFNQKRDSYAAYARVEYNFADVWSLAGGLRWSRDQIGVNNYTAWAGDTGSPQIITTIPSTDKSRSFSNVSGEATLTYRPSSHFLAYGSFKQGYRTGAFNAQAVNAPGELTVAPPETADSWEAGFKSDFLDRRVTFNLTGFYTKYRNQQIVSGESINGLLLLPLRSIDRSRIYGAETDLTVRPTDRLTLSLSGGYANGAYEKGIVGGQSIAGKRLQASARWSGTVAADWKVLDFNDASINLHVDTNFQSRAYYDPHNTPGVDDPGHAVTNFNLSYNLAKWTASFWMTNALNKHYFTYVLNTTGLGSGYFIRGAPRMFGFRLRREF